MIVPDKERILQKLLKFYWILSERVVNYSLLNNPQFIGDVDKQ